MRELKGLGRIELITIVVLLAFGYKLVSKHFINKDPVADIQMVTSVAGRLSLAARMNFYSRSIKATDGTAVLNCQAVANTLSSPLSPNYKIVPQPIEPDKTVSCIVTGPHSTSAKFLVRGIR